MIFSLFKKNQRCLHRKITPFCEGNFCPDCGREIEISWLILRCRCCRSKRKARIVFGSIFAENKYCIKCGEAKCYVEKKEILEFYDIQYAIISKKEVGSFKISKEMLQIWIENEENFSRNFNNIKFIPLLINPSH